MCYFYPILGKFFASHDYTSRRLTGNIYAGAAVSRAGHAHVFSFVINAGAPFAAIGLL